MIDDIIKLPDPVPEPQVTYILDDTAMRQGRKLMRKWQGSIRHPSSDHARWINERNMWMWFQKYGKQLLEREK